MEDTMKQQASLITTLLVIVESIAVVGFLFLIFAVSANNYGGKYEYIFKIQGIDSDDVKNLSEAIVLINQNNKSLSFKANESGKVQMRVKKDLHSVLVSANGYYTQKFNLNSFPDSGAYIDTLKLQKVKEELSDLSSVIKPLNIINESGEDIDNAIITIFREKSVYSHTFDSNSESYQIKIPQNSDTPVRLHIAADGYFPQSNVLFDENTNSITLKKAGNLALPFEFQVLLFDEEEHASYSGLSNMDGMKINDAAPVHAKKSVKDASISINQGAVVKEALGTFRVFSRENENIINIHAPGYKNQELNIIDGAKDDNIYKVYMKKSTLNFDQEMNVKVIDVNGQLIASKLHTSDAAVEEKNPGLYRIYTRNDSVSINVDALGYKPQKVALNAKEKKDYVVTLKADKHRNINFKISDRKNGKPVKSAILTVSDKNNQFSIRTDSLGKAKLKIPYDASKVLVAAPGYITQTFSIPKKIKKNESIEYKLRTNPMMDVTKKMNIQVKNRKNEPLPANITSNKGYIKETEVGEYSLYTSNDKLQVRVTAPGYEYKTLEVDKKDLDKPLKVSLKKIEDGVVLNTDIGDRLILSKGVVYRVVQPIDKDNLRVYRRTDPHQGKFNDYPEGKVISISEFNRQIKKEKQHKHFYDENVWITVYALNKKEYLLFKNSYRKQWPLYKLVYANHR